MTPTENLIKEHEVVNEFMTIMEEINCRIKSKSVFYSNDIEQIIEFITHFIEKSHHEKEEVLYSALAKKDLPIDKESISLLLYEHVLLRNYQSDIVKCITNCKMGYSFSGEMLAESLANYVLLERSHFQKELNILYPLADSLISFEEQRIVLQAFEDIEERIEDHDFQYHYSILLNDLRNKYPTKNKVVGLDLLNERKMKYQVDFV